jgi:hypothetical protein
MEGQRGPYTTGSRSGSSSRSPSRGRARSPSTRSSTPTATGLGTGGAAPRRRPGCPGAGHRGLRRHRARPRRHGSVAPPGVLLPTCHARGLTAALATRAHDLDGDGDHADDVGRDARNGHPATCGTSSARPRSTWSPSSAARRERARGGSAGWRLRRRRGARRRRPRPPDHRVRPLPGRRRRRAGGHSHPDLRAVAAWVPRHAGRPWLRTADPVAFRAFTGPWLGPAVLGLPAAELPVDATPARRPSCHFAGPPSMSIASASSSSPAWTPRAARSRRPAAWSSSPTSSPWSGGAPGSPDGGFRDEIPADANDRLHVAIYERAYAIASYDPDAGCAVAPDTPRVATVYEWGAGPIATGTTDGRGVVICSAPRDARVPGAPHPRWRSAARAHRWRRPRAPDPRFRRWMDLARHVTAPGDPAAFAPHLGLAPPSHEGSAARAPTAACC